MQLFPFLDDAIDSGPLLLLVLLLVLGTKLVERDEKLQTLGKKIALGAFFLFVAVLANHQEPSMASAWVAIIVRSLIFAGIVLGAAWTILPSGVFVYEHTLGALFRSLDESARASRKREEEKKRALEQQLRNEEWERMRPERERLAKEAALLAEAQAKLRSAGQKRREDARAACELAYAIVAPEIGNRFSKADFTAFVSKYMTDSFPPEQVEERAVQLKAIIQQHQEKIVPAQKFRSMQDLAVWFEQQKSQLEAISDVRMRSTLLVQLKERYSELTTQMLSELSS